MPQTSKAPGGSTLPASRPQQSSKPPRRVAESGFILSMDESESANAKTEAQTPRKKHKLFSDFRNIYSSYETGKVIGGNLFTPGVCHDIRQAVLHSPVVKSAIEQSVATSRNVTVPQVKAEVIKILTQMNAEPQEQILRSMTYSVQKILKRLYRYVTIIDSQLDQLKAIAKKAEDQGIPLIIMPCHKSHIDYMVISWLFYQKGISMPFVAAGENLDMPIVGSLLQASGAFFIRRQFGTDPLYRVVFNEYITQVLQRGYNLEFFMEGGRSRTGKLLTPKMGLFSVVCEAFFNGRLKDAYVVPVWIGYDKVIETEGYIQEMLGRSKPPESLLQLLRAIELLKLNFGSLEVRFSEPYSLKEAVGREMATRNLKQVFLFSSPTSSLSSSSLASSAAGTVGGSKSAAELSALALSASTNPSSQLSITRRQLVNVLAYQTMYKINMSSSALPTSLVVTVLLTHEGRGLSKPQLVRRVSWLRDEITKRGGKVCTLQGNPASVIDQVAVLLGSAIGRHNHLLETVYTPLKRFELSYYRNSLIHFFVSESVIACCLYSFRINGARLGKNGKIPKSELMNAAQYLSRLLKHEFIYKPLPDFADTFEECLQWMVHEGIVTAEKSSSASPSPATSSLTVGSQITLQTLSSHTGADTAGDLADSVEAAQTLPHSSQPSDTHSASDAHSPSSPSSTTSPGDDILIGINEDNYMFKFLCFLLWPFIECYWMVAASFQGLFPNHMVEEAEFIKSVQKFGETLYYEGELNFYESVSKETTKLALTRFYERQVIVKRVINEKGAAVVHLGEAYTRDEAKLRRFSNKIAQYRRKGKYRTSVGTVDTRAIASLIPGAQKKTKL